MNQIKLPSNIDELSRIANEYKFKDDIYPPLPVAKLNDDYRIYKNVEKQYIDTFEKIKVNLERKKKKFNILLKSLNNLDNIDEIYKNDIDNKSKEIYSKDKAERINKRLVEFYNKDYDLKMHIKKYLKYIYFGLIIFLIALLIYKKKHKNKKTMGFILLLILLPLFIIQKIFYFVMLKVGHFKLDVLYSLFIILMISVIYGIFMVAKKLLLVLGMKSNNNTVNNIMNSSKKEIPKIKQITKSLQDSAIPDANIGSPKETISKAKDAVSEAANNLFK